VRSSLLVTLNVDYGTEIDSILTALGNHYDKGKKRPSTSPQVTYTTRHPLIFSSLFVGDANKIVVKKNVDYVKIKI